MSVLSLERAVIEPPAHLPVTHLSVSSLTLFQRAPCQWKRRYIDHAYETSTGKMTIGSAAAAALCQHFGQQAETGVGYSTEQLLDEFDAVWTERGQREEIDYEGEEPGRLKDSAIRTLRLYHKAIAPTITPISAEREFELSWPGVDWKLTGYIDLETIENRIVDHKMTAKRWGEPKVHAALQPTVLLAARQAEGNPADGFDYHLLVRTQNPQVPVMPAQRSQQRIEALTSLVFSLARQIAWRWQADCWNGPVEDLAWMCKGCNAANCEWRLAA